MRPNRFHRFYVHERYKYEWSVVYMMWHGMYFVEKRKFFDMLIVSIIILFPSFNTLCAVSIALFDRSNLKAENSKRTREGHHDTEITQKKFHTNNNLLNILMKFVISIIQKDSTHPIVFIQFKGIGSETARNASFISFARFLHLHMYL